MPRRLVRRLNCVHARRRHAYTHRILDGSLATAALLGVTLWAGDTPAIAQATQSNARGGAYLFTTYCAVCHGTNARGDGPLANSMRRRPADLTEITKRNKGVYSSDLVHRIIDGR